MNELLEVFGVDWRLIVIQAINFALLLIILWYFLYRPVLRIIEERQVKIKKGVEDAEEAATQLLRADEQKDSIITDATAKASVLFEKAKIRGIEKEKELVKTARVRSEEIQKDALLKAEEVKRRALEESKTEIAQLAIMGAEKILQKKTQ